MNELIEKLAEQAMAKAVAKNFTGDKLELRMPSEAWAKEFTELIIYDFLSELTNDDALGQARIATIQRLAKKWGVER